MKRKIEFFFDEYGAYLFYGTVLVFLIAFLIYAIASPSLNEGLVMNKRFSPGYMHCYDGKCHASSDRWIIEVQNGDQKDWWTVTESYYDEVKLGEWVTK